MKKLTMLVGASLLAITGSVFAEQSLTDAQMDGVNGGAAVAVANEFGFGLGNVWVNTTGSAHAIAVYPFKAVASARNTTLAISKGYGAVAVSSASTHASLQ